MKPFGVVGKVRTPYICSSVDFLPFSYICDVFFVFLGNESIKDDSN